MFTFKKLELAKIKRVSNEDFQISAWSPFGEARSYGIFVYASLSS